ncbi:hypothetical protein [Photobacterium ganghwense]|uniref:hypothetical protein n=1 Tax=Photobacterium ganghwense TaxID=320778 RepID=UPI0039F0CF41
MNIYERVIGSFDAILLSQNSVSLPVIFSCMRSLQAIHPERMGEWVRTQGTRWNH